MQQKYFVSFTIVPNILSIIIKNKITFIKYGWMLNLYVENRRGNSFRYIFSKTMAVVVLDLA